MTKLKTLKFCLFTLVHPTSPYSNSKGDDGRRDAMMITPLKKKKHINELHHKPNKQKKTRNYLKSLLLR
jgi:hypothetical protein